MKLTGKNYVAGKLSSRGDVTFKTFNPNLNSENNVKFYQANNEEIENAADLAFNAFKVYQKISDKNKAIFLDEIAYQIDNLGEQLINLYTVETGLPKGRAEKKKKISSRKKIPSLWNYCNFFGIIFCRFVSF